MEDVGEIKVQHMSGSESQISAQGIAIARLFNHELLHVGTLLHREEGGVESDELHCCPTASQHSIELASDTKEPTFHGSEPLPTLADG